MYAMVHGKEHQERSRDHRNRNHRNADRELTRKSKKKTTYEGKQQMVDGTVDELI